MQCSFDQRANPGRVSQYVYMHEIFILYATYELGIIGAFRIVGR